MIKPYFVSSDSPKHLTHNNQLFKSDEKIIDIRYFPYLLLSRRFYANQPCDRKVAAWVGPRKRGYQLTVFYFITENDHCKNKGDAVCDGNGIIVTEEPEQEPEQGAQREE